MDAVIDTNILVSGLLNPAGPPGEIVDLIFSGQLEPVYDDRIIHEYAMVLKRGKFSFPVELIDELLGAIKIIGLNVVPHHTSLKLPDDYDRPFVECALASSEKLLITGNIRHFPASAVKGIVVLPPKDFLEKYLRPH
jgi:uncharacterized protein